MPLTITIYPDEDVEVPEKGDTLVVTAVHEAFDMHWGECVVVDVEQVEVDQGQSE